MPGLYIHAGNSLEKLAGSLAGLFRENPPADPFTPEIIVLQSRGMQRWVSMRLSESLGVLSNCEFPFPNAFIHGMFENVLGERPDPGYSPDSLRFALMGIIESMKNEPALAPIGRYVSDDKSRLKLVQLSCSIADMFDQYLVFRPDLLLGWDMGRRFFRGRAGEDSEEWQARIWNAAASRLGRHAAQTRQDFFKRLEAGKPDRMPERVSVFGISHLPRFHMDVLAAMSQYSDIHFFLLNPCRQFWMYVEKEINIIRKTERASLTADKLHFETGNTLLASMGRQGRDFFGYLYGLDGVMLDDEGLWETPPEDTVLGRIRNDILELRNGPGKLQERYEIDPSDNSVLIESCHSPMREVEVLRESLLRMFEEDPGLRPEEIVVMSPDINEYAPYVDAVFGSASGRKDFIPYSISDRPYADRSAADGFFSLLGLSDLRFRASALLGILDGKAVKERFSISAEEAGVIRDWVRTTCIRWGIDAGNRKTLGLDATDNNTWRAGLDRLLAGFAMPGDMLFRGMLAVDGIEGERADLLGRFLAFAGMAFAYGMKLAGSRSLPRWSELLLGMIEDMLDTGTGAQEILMLRNAVSALFSASGFDGEVGVQAVRHLIKSSMSEPSAGRFLSSGVTFCSLLPMRSIPMKVICLIGMNDDSYPRQNVSAGFNLIGREPRMGDRSPRDDDRYLFLEAIVSAGKRLYISYTGQDIRDNSIKPPSVLVSELLDYIKSYFDIAGLNLDDPEKRDKTIEERFVVRQALQGFSPRYFTGADGRFFSYSRGACAAARLLGSETAPQKPFMDAVIGAGEDVFRELPAETLAGFFSNPVRFFLRNRLGITVRSGVEEIIDREPITTDRLEDFNIRQKIADGIIKGQDTLPVIKAQGLLPHGAAGIALYEKLSGEAMGLVERFRAITRDEAGEEDSFEIEAGDHVISGGFRLYGCGLVFLRPSVISARHLVNAWLWHVLLCSSGKGNATRLVGYKRTKEGKAAAVWSFNQPENPSSVLEGILGIFREGLNRPVHFFPELSMKFAESIVKGADEEKAVKNAVRGWEGDGFNDGKREKDPHYIIYPGEACPIDGDFKKVSEAFFLELLKNGGWEK